MNNWLKYLVAFAAVMIAGSAAYFSVTGLGVLFSGASIAVMVMAGSLEYAKLVTATYLKQKWDDIQGFNKWYLTSAVVILMAITSAGIFGYLSNAFQQQNIKLDQVQREIDVWNNKITNTNQQIATLQSQQKDLSATQSTLITKGNVNSRLIRSADNRDRQSTKLSNKINSLQDSIVVFNGKINDIKNANISIEREVGGFRFVAEAFGVELKSVVKFFIFLIVIVFDPLAIALVIALNSLIGLNKKEEPENIQQKEETNPEVLKDFIDETTRLHLTDDDLKKLEEVLLNPPVPNDKLKEAAQKYSDEVREKHVHINDFEIDEEPYAGPESIFPKEVEYDDEYYKPQYENPIPTPLESTPEPQADFEIVAEVVPTQEEVVPALSDEEVREMVLDEFEGKFNTNEEEEVEEIIEPTEQEEKENFETLNFTDEFISDAIEEFNQESLLDNDWEILDSEWTPELEEQFWAEQVPEPFATPEEIENEPVYQSDNKEMDESLEIINNALEEPQIEVFRATNNEDWSTPPPVEETQEETIESPQTEEDLKKKL